MWVSLLWKCFTIYNESSFLLIMSLQFGSFISMSKCNASRKVFSCCICFLLDHGTPRWHLSAPRGKQKNLQSSHIPRIEVRNFQPKVSLQLLGLWMLHLPPYLFASSSHAGMLFSWDKEMVSSASSRILQSNPYLKKVIIGFLWELRWWYNVVVQTRCRRVLVTSGPWSNEQVRTPKILRHCQSWWPF